MVVKFPTSWIPQPLGYGYVTPGNTGNTPGAGFNLTDQSGNVLTDQNGKQLNTGPVTITGRYAALWSDTGA